MRGHRTTTLLLHLILSSLDESRSLDHEDTSSYVVQIHTSAATLDASISRQTAFPMTAQNGRRFTCYDSSSHDDTDMDTDMDTNSSVLDTSRSAIARLKTTHTECFTLQDGAWDISICNERLVRKYFRETNEVVDLGEFRGDDLRPREGGLPGAEWVYTQHYGPSTVVQYDCDDDAETTSVVAHGRRRDEQGDDGDASGEYFLITSPVFCLHETERHEREFMTQLLRPLEGECMTKIEGWWTYEVCLGHHVRQYHRDGKSGRLSAEYSLGQYDPTTASVFTEEHHLDGAHERAARVALIQQFIHGTACANNVRRSTKLNVYCQSKSLVHEILSIKEVQTCQYEVSISTPAVCTHPRFEREREQAKDITHVVHCIPDLTPIRDDL